MFNMDENKEFDTLEGADIEVVQYDQEKADNTMTDPKYDWSGKMADGKGDD